MKNSIQRIYSTIKPTIVVVVVAYLAFMVAGNMSFLAQRLSLAFLVSYLAWVVVSPNTSSVLKSIEELRLAKTEVTEQKVISLTFQRLGLGLFWYFWIFWILAGVLINHFTKFRV